MDTLTSTGGGGPEPKQPRMFGGYLEQVRLPWKWAIERLTRAQLLDCDDSS